MLVLPSQLSPRLKTKAKKNAAKYRATAEQQWREWITFEMALANATPVQAQSWQSFEFFRLAIANHKTYDHMKVWLEALFTGQDSRYLQGIAGNDTLVLAPRESAKAQPLTEFVLTPSGWKCMGDIKQGDLVIADDGTPTTVTHVHPQGRKSCYKITFTDGATVECSDDHLWTVRSLYGSNPKEFKTLPLNQIRSKVFVLSRRVKRGDRIEQETIYRDALPEEKPWLDYRGYPKFFIPITKPIEFPKLNLVINPYTMGVLLGDGTFYPDSVRFSKSDLDVVEFVRKTLPKGYSVKQIGKRENQFIISKTIKKGKASKSIFLEEIRKLGLTGHGSSEKFIPKSYLFSSVEDRIFLLQGLMDTDGTVSKKHKGGGGLSYSTTSKQLADDVIDLVRSLGGIATHQKPQKPWYKHKGERRQGKLSYNVEIKLPEDIQPFRLPRKSCLYSPCTTYKPTRGIVNIEYIGDVEMQCITVEHPNQRYITRDYVVTHNSTFLAQFISYEIGIHTSPWIRLAFKVLGISYNIETALPRSRQIQAILQSPKYQEIFPWVRPSKQKWGEKEWMIDLDWAGLPSTEEQYTYVCGGLNGGLNSRRCVVGETRVLTEKGEIPIAELGNYIGIYIITFNETTEDLEWGKLNAIASRISHKIIEITTHEGLQVKLTPEHPLYVATYGYVQAKNLEVGDWLVTYKDGDWSVDVITNISEIESQEEVYDIEVEGNHNFFANKILAHNCHLAFLDDLIKSPEAIRAQSIRDAMVSTWRSVVQFCRYDGSRALCLGTQMAANDIYCTEFTEENRWRVIRQSALLEREDGTEYSYWEPEDDKSPGTPLVRLQKEREEMPIEFAFQRQNKVVRVKEQSINPELIQRAIIPTRFDTLVLGCDLSAGKKESNDYTAMVLGGLVKGAKNDPDQYWIIDSWEDRIMGNIEKLDAMIEIWDMWQHLLPTVKLFDPEKGEWLEVPESGLNLFFDSSAYGLSLQGDYEDYIIGQKKIVTWRVHPVPASGRGDKLYRLRKHTGLFTNGLVWFNMYGRTMKDSRRPMGRLVQQITEFGSTSHDDLCDAFELCMTGLRSNLPMTKGSY
ncbi:hypothetical protein PCC6912_50970 [Chlorogloeopsis fritschii PCC 6912]|uniref:DOD-type homing endonuclease domain-containing protein n=1 Tax=Chlorogloeopsis fritschii PCC 6912 TaxID=211165 RepID=A0A433N1Y3_CHLFR|nr:hint domain-containing protein [Chlorogloeopsis fritschii]RUR74919.1 hypothetical protein PCC6912_50970 [Chlorogloeopsis fritschii PCC 6912]